MATAGAFPDDGIVPKGEIGADRFLSEHAAFDGRGVVVAIFDTGVDPGAVGLTHTPDGGPKVIDILDATGSGDVSMGDPVKIVDGTVTGKSGRTLRVGSTWGVRDQEVRLGLKAAWELFPSRLIGRLKEKRREAWDAAQLTLIRELQAAVDTFKRDHPEPDAAQKEELAEREARLAICTEMGKTYDDPGPVFDCVVFHDGARWRAVVDTDEDGDLEEEKVLADFDVAQEFATFGAEDLLNFGVHMYDDGRVLSLVVDSGTHGTHVAGIVGAYFPDDPARHGLAPGVRLVSVKIGDTRLGTMETGHALRRALTAARAHRVDLVNMSYGEPTRTPNRSSLMDELKELVYEDGILFVAAAGNDGPALSTVGAPGGTTSAVLGVGAYLSPAVMRAGHSFLRELAGTHYTWSSRGPTQDGDLGVDISAPGAAIAPVPRWTLERDQLMNGTSMASPNACGGLALLLSGLKQSGIAYSAASVKRAVTTTAETLESVEVFAQGHGMLRIDRAFDWLRALPPEEHAWPRFEVSVGDQRGISLRGGTGARRKQTFRAEVTPRFPKAAPRLAVADFAARISLRPTVAWIATPEFYVAASRAKSFDVEVDPTGLEPGAHFGEVLGFAVGREESGPLFRVPVTVIRPMDVDWGERHEWSGEFDFEAGTIHRLFFDLPDGATWAALEMRGLGLEGPRHLVAHVQHAGPHEAHRHLGRSFNWSLDRDTRDRQGGSFAVRGGEVVEVCLAQNWSSLGSGRYEARLRLHGTAAIAREAHFARGTKAYSVTAVSRLQPESIEPSARLTAFHRSLPPARHSLRALVGDARDAMRDGRAAHELILEYPFTLTGTATVTPRFPALNDRLYETEFESQLQILQDANRRVVGFTDTYPRGFKLEQGEYRLRLHLRHADREALQKLEDLTAVLDVTLPKALDLPIHRQADHALTRNPADGPGVLTDGQWLPLFLGEPDWKALPAMCVDGDILVGAFVLQKGAPDALPLALPIRIPKPTADATATPAEPVDGVLELQRQWLESLMRKKHFDEFDTMAADLLESHPDDLALRLLLLKRHTGDTWRDHPAAVLEAADRIIQHVDQPMLAAHFGVRPADGPATSESKAMRTARDAITTALSWKVRALIATQADYQDALKDLQKWADLTEKQFDPLQQERLTAEARWGQLLARIRNGDLAKKDKARQQLEIFQHLGWNHWIAAEESRLLRAYPDADPAF